MRILLVATLLCGLAAPGLAAEFREGLYTVEGTNLNGSPYGGTAEVSLLSETTCQIHWITGGTESWGHCMKVGDYVSAGYIMGENTIGVIMYMLQEDGSLDGYWTISGQNGSGTERLMPQ
jgi:hypothetical protein